MTIHNTLSSAAIPYDYSEAPTQNLRECIIPNVSDDLKPPSPNQENFIEMSYHCFEEVLGILNNIPSTTFQDLLVLVGNHRQTIAIMQQNFDWKRFGVLRTGDICDKVSTDLIGEYLPLINPLMEIGNDDPSMKWEYYSKSGFSQVRLGHRIGVTSNGEKIPLSKYILSGEKGKNTIAHSYPMHLPKILNECSFLFQEIMRLKAISHGNQIHHLIAKLHWWTAHGCFYLRGSAFGAEIITAALTYLKFDTLSPYQKNIIPDQIALINDEDTFIQIYPSLRITK